MNDKKVVTKATPKNEYEKSVSSYNKQLEVPSQSFACHNTHVLSMKAPYNSGDGTNPMRLCIVPFNPMAADPWFSSTMRNVISANGTLLSAQKKLIKTKPSMINGKKEQVPGRQRPLLAVVLLSMKHEQLKYLSFIIFS